VVRVVVRVVVSVVSLSIPGVAMTGCTGDDLLASGGAAGTGADDYYADVWERLVRTHGELDGMDDLVVGEPDDMDGFLRSLFPAIGDKPIGDVPIEVPGGLVFEHAGFAPYAVPVPVDWGADPYANVSWRLYFQSLSWIADDIDRGAALLADWVDQALYSEPALDQTWADHAASMRLDAAARLTERYIAEKAVLDRRYLSAAAQLILTHLYALASDHEYATAHNHSMMHDLAVLAWVKRYPGLRDGERMWDDTSRRMLERQVLRSVTEDGLHIENSGCYHFLYLGLVNRAIAVYRDAGAEVPPDLIRVRDSMIEPLVQHLQPDLSFAQFSDCGDADRSAGLRRMLERIRELGVGDLSLLAPLEWVTSGGERGTEPVLDRVYEAGGYAFFRDRWDLSSGAAVAGHFKVAHRSGVHYHADETTFEIFAHGHELVAEPGAFTYVADDPFRAYQRGPAGQNVLVVDEDATLSTAPTSKSRVAAYGGRGDVSWVQGTHANYEALGIESLTRTFAFVKPDTFIVIDHVRASDRHDYAQHFHLHPDVARLDVANSRTVLASVDGGPALAIVAAAAPDAIETPRGVAEDGVVQGWHFPELHVKVPAFDVVFRQTRADADLPVLFVVSAPGQAPRVPTDITYGERGGVATITWRLDGFERSLRIPSP
jgi:Heparinase II/III-like protein/Heparinase II/III N-terminus